MDKIDYKDLLRKYMTHLNHVEDTVFLELINTPFSSNVEFTSDELRALRSLERKIMDANSGSAVAENKKN